MTAEAILVFAILGASLLLFFTGWVRMDIVALLVLSILAFTGIVTPQEALAGFSNPAVVTVWAMFILSAALYQTGVARIIGRQVMRFAGEGEVRLIALIMLSAGAMSAFMNNVGVVALMLPVVMDMARAKELSPSRLLMPLAFGAMLGGLTTLIGTPPNLLISYTLADNDLRAFRLFDYTPIGFTALLGGIAFMVLVGRHLLPKKDAITEAKRQTGIPSATYDLQSRSFMLKVRPSSSLAGKSLAESRLRAGLGLNVVAIIRHGTTMLSPGPETIINSNDKLHVQGNIEALQAMQHWDVILPSQEGFAPATCSEKTCRFMKQSLRRHLRSQEAGCRKRISGGAWVSMCLPYEEISV